MDTDTLLDDLPRLAGRLQRLHDDEPRYLCQEAALALKEAAEEIRQLRARVATLEAEATTHWNELDDLKAGAITRGDE